MDNDTQRDLFSRAVQLLGGQQATGAALGINDRSVRMLLQGERRLHPGILEDLCKALIDHADECRRLERRLSPAFARNHTEDQARAPHHNGGRKGAHGDRMTDEERAQIRIMARKLGLED